MRFLPLAFLCFLSPLSASVISTTTTCNNASGPYPNLVTVSQTGDRSCGLQTNITDIPPYSTSLYGLQISSASASGTYSLTPNGFTANLSVSAAAYPQSTSSARVDFVDTFTTVGPVRTGIARGFFMPGESHYGGGFGWDIDFPGLWPNLNTFGDTPRFTVTLGQEFTVAAYLSARAITDDGTASFASVSAPFYLSFFEADGVTPVALSEVSAAPEATTWVFGSLGLLTVFVTRRRLATNPANLCCNRPNTRHSDRAF